MDIMKKEYPDYRKLNLDLEEVFNTLPSQTQSILNNFMIEVSTTTSKASQKKVFLKIVQIADILEKELTKLSDDDVTKFLALLNNSDKAVATINDTKKVLKRFLRWYYADWSKRFKSFKAEKWKCSSKKEARQLVKSDLLTADEMKMIVNAAESLKMKTLLLVMQETANRPEEVLKWKWKDIDFKKKEVKLYSSKTGETRHIPINESIAHLQRYKTECFYIPPTNEDWVFPQSKYPDKHMTPQDLEYYLRKIEKKLKFSKHLYPYLWRHSVLSQMIKKLSPKVYEMYSGHALETGMKIYSHLDTDDLREELYKKVYEIEELTKGEKQEFEKLKKEFKDFKKEGLNEMKKYKEMFESYVKEVKEIQELVKNVK